MRKPTSGEETSPSIVDQELDKSKKDESKDNQKPCAPEDGSGGVCGDWPRWVRF